MSKEKQNKPSRDAVALNNMVHAMAKQRIQLLRHLVEHLDDNSRIRVGEPAESLAMLEEIQTLAQLIHDHASQQLLEQCMPREEDAFPPGNKDKPSTDTVPGSAPAQTEEPGE